MTGDSAAISSRNYRRKLVTARIGKAASWGLEVSTSPLEERYASNDKSVQADSAKDECWARKSALSASHA
jgi:hypothetical protein